MGTTPLLASMFDVNLPDPADCQTPTVTPAMRAGIVSYLDALDRTPPFSWDSPDMYQHGSDEPAMMEVRLQVHDDGTWSIHTGDPQYDQDHRGAWGDAVVAFEGAPDGTTFDAEETADELIDALESGF